MKTGKTLKLAGALAASLALLTVLAGCGQSSKPSPKSETPSGTPAKSASRTSPSTQASSPPASSSSSSAPGSSFASSTSTGSSASASTASSTPSASSSSADSTGASTQQMPSNEVLYLLAYIKYRGGLEAITPSDLIVDEYMIGTQKGTVLPNTLPTQVPLQMVVSGGEVKVIGPAPPTPESDPMYSLKALYNIENLIGEYYATPSQQSEVNSLLQEGERHNLLDVLALLKAMQVKPTEYYEEGTVRYASPDGSNSLAIGADTSALVVINGKEVTICISGAAAAGYPVHYSYFHYEAPELLSEYYSTTAQQTAINRNIDAGISGYMG